MIMVEVPVVVYRVSTMVTVLIVTIDVWNRVCRAGHTTLRLGRLIILRSGLHLGVLISRQALVFLRPPVGRIVHQQVYRRPKRCLATPVGLRHIQPIGLSIDQQMLIIVAAPVEQPNKYWTTVMFVQHHGPPIILRRGQTLEQQSQPQVALLLRRQHSKLHVQPKFNKRHMWEGSNPPTIMSVLPYRRLSRRPGSAFSIEPPPL